MPTLAAITGTSITAAITFDPDRQRAVPVEGREGEAKRCSPAWAHPPNLPLDGADSARSWGVPAAPSWLLLRGPVAAGRLLFPCALFFRRQFSWFRRAPLHRRPCAHNRHPPGARRKSILRILGRLPALVLFSEVCPWRGSPFPDSFLPARDELESLPYPLEAACPGKPLLCWEH